MSAAPAVSVRGLSKLFRVYRRPIDLAKEVLTGRPHHTAFPALQDLSFDIAPGEVVGFIGRNGSGKSTLLRVIAGTLDWSAGEVRVNGKVSAILELGTGFSPEFSGRENIYLGGLCLGMSRAEIDAKFDAIVEFSELREFIDQPFRTYSSGMKCRLTFAVSIAVDLEILIIDEALAVGDASFQAKCFRKIDEFRRAGKTILFVSHDENILTSFCTRAILLERGRVVVDGTPAVAMKRYMEVIYGPKNYDQPAQEPAPGGFVTSKDEHRFGSREAEVYDLGIMDAKGQRVSVLQSGQRYTAFFYVCIHADVPSLSAGFVVRNPRGIDLFGVGNTSVGGALGPQQKGKVLVVKAELSMWLAAGEYFLTVGAGRTDGMQYDLRNDALHFSVVGTPQLFTTSSVNLEPRFSIEPA